MGLFLIIISLGSALKIQFVSWLGNEFIPYLGNRNCLILKGVAIKIDWYYLNIFYCISTNKKGSDTWVWKNTCSVGKTSVIHVSVLE